MLNKIAAEKDAEHLKKRNFKHLYKKVDHLNYSYLRKIHDDAEEGPLFTAEQIKFANTFPEKYLPQRFGEFISRYKYIEWLISQKAYQLPPNDEYIFIHIKSWYEDLIPAPDIFNMSLSEAATLAEEYIETKSKQNIKPETNLINGIYSTEDEPAYKSESESEVVYRFDNGYKVLRVGKNDYKKYGDQLRNCLRRESYGNDDEYYRTYVLLDRNDNVHVAIATNEYNEITNVRSTNNTYVKTKYLNFIEEFIKATQMNLSLGGQDDLYYAENKQKFLDEKNTEPYFDYIQTDSFNLKEFNQAVTDILLESAKPASNIVLNVLSLLLKMFNKLTKYQKVDYFNELKKVLKENYNKIFEILSSKESLVKQIFADVSKLNIKNDFEAFKISIVSLSNVVGVFESSNINIEYLKIKIPQIQYTIYDIKNNLFFSEEKMMIKKILEIYTNIIAYSTSILEEVLKCYLFHNKSILKIQDQKYNLNELKQILHTFLNSSNLLTS